MRAGIKSQKLRESLFHELGDFLRDLDPANSSPKQMFMPPKIGNDSMVIGENETLQKRRPTKRRCHNESVLGGAGSELKSFATIAKALQFGNS